MTLVPALSFADLPLRAGLLISAPGTGSDERQCHHDAFVTALTTFLAPPTGPRTRNAFS